MRLLQEEIPRYAPTVDSQDKIRFLSHMLVVTRYAAPAAELTEAAKTVPDAAIQDHLRAVAKLRSRYRR